MSTEYDMRLTHNGYLQIAFDFSPNTVYYVIVKYKYKR